MRGSRVIPFRLLALVHIPPLKLTFIFMSSSKKQKQSKSNSNQTRVDDVRNALRVFSTRLAKLEAPSDTKLIEGYVDVKKDVKTQPPAVKTDHPDLRSLLHAMGGGKRPKLNNLRTKISVSGTLNGSSGTAITTVINVRPAAYSEFASFAALFDEFKVHGGMLHFNIWATGQNAVVVGNDAAFGYDPVDNGVYASVAGVLVSSQHIGPIQALSVTDSSVPSTGARTAAPSATSKHGFWGFPFKCPKQPQFVPNNSQQVMTGEWCDTNISSSLGDYGYLKPYVTSAGSTTATVSYYLVLDIEFRSRT